MKQAPPGIRCRKYIAQALIEAGADHLQPNHDGVFPSGRPPTQAIKNLQPTWKTRHPTRQAIPLARQYKNHARPPRLSTKPCASRKPRSLKNMALRKRHGPLTICHAGFPIETPSPASWLLCKPCWMPALLRTGPCLRGHATALMQAARAGELDMVELLLARGAKVTHSTEKGLTALHMALFKPSARRHVPSHCAPAEWRCQSGCGRRRRRQRPLHMALRHAIAPLVVLSSKAVPIHFCATLRAAQLPIGHRLLASTRQRSAPCWTPPVDTWTSVARTGTDSNCRQY